MTGINVEKKVRRRSGKRAMDISPESSNLGTSDVGISVKMHEKGCKDRKKGRNTARLASTTSTGSSQVIQSSDGKNNTSLFSIGKTATTLRKPVDPQTAKYFLEISNLFQSGNVDSEEHSTICSNALEETKGKEFELATDVIISHTLQKLVESCNLDQLCSFLCNCAEVFPTIAMDRSGSHVAEAALKSIGKHFLDYSSRGSVEVTLEHLCKALAADSINVMKSSYGSHVLRTLLCLCKGVSVERLQEFHATKTSAMLTERFISGSDRLSANNAEEYELGFPGMFTFLVREIIGQIKDEIVALRVDKYSSFVLQTALKLSVGDDQELSHVISVLLASGTNDDVQGKLIHRGRQREFMTLLNDTSSSHLLELIIEVAPEEIYNDLLTEIFKGTLFNISCHQSGNFVVQSLVASAKSTEQMELIWEELGSKISELLELRKFGVVASMLAACQRLQSYRLECCEAIRIAVARDSKTSSCAIPHLLFIDSFFDCKDSWTWPMGEKMNILGCVMLQIIFKFPHQYVRSYATSLLSIDKDHILEIAKDSGGSRVLEAFISSSVSLKRKYNLMAKLRNHYGVLSLNPSSSFLVEKCFFASNTDHKELIVSELASVRSDLSKTRHGLHLMRKLDVDRYVRHPEQWKACHLSKGAAQKEFENVLGLESKLKNPQSSSKKRKQKEKATEGMSEHTDSLMREPVSPASDDNGFNAPAAKHKSPSVTSEAPAAKHKSASVKSKAPETKHKSPSAKKLKPSKGDAKDGSKKFVKNNTLVPFLRNCRKRKSPMSNLPGSASRKSLSRGEVTEMFRAGVIESKPSMKK